jgi:hypothetical protein
VVVDLDVVVDHFNANGPELSAAGHLLTVGCTLELCRGEDVGGALAQQLLTERDTERSRIADRSRDLGRRTGYSNVLTVTKEYCN